MPGLRLSPACRRWKVQNQAGFPLLLRVAAGESASLLKNFGEVLFAVDEQTLSEADHPVIVAQHTESEAAVTIPLNRRGKWKVLLNGVPLILHAVQDAEHHTVTLRTNVTITNHTPVPIQVRAMCRTCGSDRVWPRECRHKQRTSLWGPQT